MPMTFDGGAAPYAAPSDYLTRVDLRLTGDLARDDGTEADPSALLADPRLAAALADASGDLEAALMKGGRYAVADLQALPAGSNALGFLKRIVCGLAIQYMREARGMLGESEMPAYRRACEALKALADGESILPFAETEAAGLPVTEALDQATLLADQPTLITNVMYRSFAIRARERGRAGYGGIF